MSVNSSCLNRKSRKKSGKLTGKSLNDLENETRKLKIESYEIKMKEKRGDVDGVTRKFLEFFGSIPEYDDVNHLSNKDFYRKLENLREKQKEYNDFLTNENKIRTKEWVNDYQNLKLEKPSPKPEKPKSFCTTPILCRKSKLKNNEDIESLSLSDKETYIKQPSSRRSVRIETPITLSLKSSSNNSSPELIPSNPRQLFPKEEWYDCDEKKEKTDGITIPKPFQMTVRDEENRIVEKCMDEVNTKERKKEKCEKFKAHPVPIESQIPLFDKIMADQDYKNFLVRERRKAELSSQMRPFSFTKRDEELQNLSRKLSKSSPCILEGEQNGDVEPKNFRAKPVPKALFSNYIYQKMYEDEFFRSLQKKIRAEEMLKAASLPPSMAKREKNKKIYDVCPKSYRTMSYDTNKEFPEFMRTKKIPDFVKLHEKYNKELEELKNEFISTSPRPFKFNNKKSRNRKENRNYSSSSSRTNSASGLRAISRSNLAAVLRIESARKRLQDHMDEKLEEARIREEARWREKILRKKPVWQALAYSNEEDLAMRLRMRKEEERLRKEEHRLRMGLMYGRVNQQPTLFERQSTQIFPKTKEEILDFIGSSNFKPQRSVSDLSNNYCIELKEEGIQVDSNEFETMNKEEE